MGAKLDPTSIQMVLALKAFASNSSMNPFGFSVSSVIFQSSNVGTIDCQSNNAAVYAILILAFILVFETITTVGTVVPIGTTVLVSLYTSISCWSVIISTSWIVCGRFLWVRWSHRTSNKIHYSIYAPEDTLGAPWQKANPPSNPDSLSKTREAFPSVPPYDGDPPIQSLWLVLNLIYPYWYRRCSILRSFRKGTLAFWSSPKIIFFYVALGPERNRES